MANESAQMAHNVLRLANTAMQGFDEITDAVYKDRFDQQMLMAYMAVLVVKASMEDTIFKNFPEPLEFQMRCLDAAKDLYEQVSK